MSSLVKSMKIYSPQDYFKTENIELPDVIITLINKLAAEVGAPNYQKTPIFKQKRNRKYDKRDEISNKDWETLRNFKTTELKKNEEGTLNAEIDTIRSLLNKITGKNYDTLKVEISDNIEKHIDNEDNLNEICKSIFEIGSMNSFWSEMYARLCKELVEKFDIMKDICKTNFTNFLDLFKNITNYNSEEDYDKFCETNKINQKRRSMSSFFIHLMNFGIINVDNMYNLIYTLIENIEENKDDKTKLFCNDEIIENLSILITKGKEKLIHNEDSWASVISVIETYAKTKYYGLTKKTTFKCYDILDEIEESNSDDDDDCNSDSSSNED